MFTEKVVKEENSGQLMEFDGWLEIVCGLVVIVFSGLGFLETLGESHRPGMMGMEEILIPRSGTPRNLLYGVFCEESLEMFR